ncbi:hypothetical protein [Actinoplanes xinjiangensis]|uniref:hypothetical protein n=1 Tax=Actinoplanes xinjiangensis TaxID=512350 RepID=UPI0034490C05
MTPVPHQRPTVADPAVAGQSTDEELRALFGQTNAVFAAITGPVHVLGAANPAFALAGHHPARRECKYVRHVTPAPDPDVVAFAA